jgi:zinc finger protein BrlA
MDMFVDRKPIHNFSNHSHTTGVSSGYHSLNTSFSSSAESAVSWEPDIATPGSTPRGSSGLVKSEDALLSTSFYNPNAYGAATGYCPMSALTQDMMSDFQTAVVGTGYVGSGKSSQDQTMMDFQSLSNYTGHLGGISCNGIPSQTPSLDHDLSSPISGDGSSPISTNFVVPSQTFLDGFELQSPMRPSSLHFNLHYDDPESEYTADFSLGSSSPGSMACHGGNMSYMMPSCNEIKSSSSSTTPTRPSTLRPPKLEQLQSPAALHRAQTQQDAEKHAKGQMARVEKRRMKRALRESILPNNWRVQNKPKKFCTWPGCNGKFQRQEHLKRHEKTHNGKEVFPCPFCEHIFNRTDNLKQHVWLHTQEGKKSSRTKYHPDALAYYQELCRKGSKPRRANNPDIIKQERGLPVRTSASTRARVSNHDVRVKEE